MDIDFAQIPAAVKVLKNGGVVMYPTETCYGLGVDIFNKGAVNRLYKVKGRDFIKPVSILVNSVKMAQKFGQLNTKALDLVRRFWPGPLSIVVKRTKVLPDFLNPGYDFVSIRYSDLKICNQLISALGVPITTTSANLSGNKPLYEVDISQFGKGDIDFVVDAGKLQMSKPSTVVKVEDDKLIVLRKGGIDLLEEGAI